MRRTEPFALNGSPGTRKHCSRFDCNLFHVRPHHYDGLGDPKRSGGMEHVP
jgi:hypothetical protein